MDDEVARCVAWPWVVAVAVGWARPRFRWNPRGLKGGDFFVRLAETRSALLLGGHASDAGGMVEGAVVLWHGGGRQRSTDLTTSCITGHPLILSHGPDFPAVVGCTCSSPRLLLVLVQTSHAFAVRQAVWPVPP
jgi:hypothetical protein